MRPTVVITRPQQQAQPWINAFRTQGFPVVHIPLLQVVPVNNAQAIQSAWACIDQWSWVMFVSANAVHSFFDHAPLNKPWPSHVRVGSPGPGTSQALMDNGVELSLIDQPTQAQAKDSQQLWQNVGQRAWKSCKVLLVRGHHENSPPRDWLMNQLQNAGAKVYPLVTYERRSGLPSPELQAWICSEQAKQACWVFSSVQAFESLVGYDWTQTTAIVIHSCIADAAYNAGFGRVICTQPDLNSLIDSVESVV